MTFPKRLIAWREKKGMPQKEAADFFAVTKSAYEKWEKGTRTPTKLSMAEIERRMSQP